MDAPEKNERNKLMESIKSIYKRALAGLSVDKNNLEPFLGPPPPGFTHAIREKRRARNYRSRESRRYNRLRAKGARV